MPILERDAWREQYFNSTACPDDVAVPVDDIDTWALFPQHNWIYDRLRIAQSQGFNAAPHGVMPESYPVFSKPIINLRGMGAGSCIIRSADEMVALSTPGHFWMPLLEGDHLSTDCAIVNGDVRWMRHAHGTPAGGGMFRHWRVMAEDVPTIATHLKAWIALHVPTYTGMMNFETIGMGIIEAHLRFTDQWVDLYGPGWVQSLVGLYTAGEWSFAELQRHDGFSIPLFGKPTQPYHHPPPDVTTKLLATPGISSVQITFHDGADPRQHAQPPGGMRLGLINAWDLNSGLQARDCLASCFPAKQIIAT